MEQVLEQALRYIGKFINDLAIKSYAIMSGAITAVLGYFIPVRDIVHLLLLFFILNTLIGAWAAVKVKNEKFSFKIIWDTTIVRMLLALVLILSAYMWDTVYNQNVVCTYKIIGWFISGVLLYSIAKNSYLITKWAVFIKLAGLFKSKTRDETGLDIPEDEYCENKKKNPDDEISKDK